MADLYRRFKTDDRAETEGVVLDYGGGTRIRVARAGGSNRRYLAALDRIHKKYRRQIELGAMDPDLDARLMREAIVDTVILGWEGVTGSDGASLPFTRENALKLFEDLPDLYRDVTAQARDAALFRADLEADSKN